MHLFKLFLYYLCYEGRTQPAIKRYALYLTKILIQNRMIGWMDDLRFYVLFNSVTVISGRPEVDNERLCVMELRYG